MQRIATALAAAGGLCLAVQAIYTAAFGVWDPVVHRPVLLAGGLLIALLVKPLAVLHPSENRALRAVQVATDLALAATILLACFLYIDVGEKLESGIFVLPGWMVWAALAGIFVLLEMTRRFFGLPLTVIGAACLIYVLFGEYLPGMFRHAGYDLETAMQGIWYSTSGIFGLPLAILINLVFIFIVFGAVLEGTGTGNVLLRFAFAATGRLRGGPAHAAIVASAMFGTMSGSVIANVVGTGTMTIPMIKRRGFKPRFAGAVEAAASTGGQITPPVMGVGAFMMAEFTGVPYLYITIAAAAPAVYYYVSLFLAVSLEARKLRIEPIPAAERERLSRRDYLYALAFVIPIITIVLVLLAGRSPAMAGLAATIATVLSALLLPEFRNNPQRLIRSLVNGGLSCATIIVAVGLLGVIIGAMDLTGLGIRFAQEISGVAGQSLFPALVLTMAVCLILGMGMPTVPAYIIVVLVLGPTISKLGVELIVIHLFVFYFGVLSAITPPVALAAYAAAPIAESNPIETGLTALRLSVIAFVVPFVFVREPALLIIPQATGEVFALGPFLSVALRLGLALWLFTTALFRFDREALPLPICALRLVLGVGVLIIHPLVQIAAAVVAIVLLAEHHVLAPRRWAGAPAPMAAAGPETTGRKDT